LSSQTRIRPAKGVNNRAFRGLVAVFLLSFLNLAGLLLTITALGGLGEWSNWQFAGLFGVIEAAGGLANIIVPNIWRLPVAELQTSARTRIKLAASTILIPHWGGAARSAAGLLLMGVAAGQEGLGPASIGLVPLLLAVSVVIVGLSAIVARAGVARPNVDVVQFVVRWNRKEHELPAISLGASVVQFCLSLITIPAVKTLPPGALYQPELGPSTEALLVSVGSAAVITGLVYALWGSRVDWHAPREQQREAEEHA
jgi:hypothetical protein